MPSPEEPGIVLSLQTKDFGISYPIIADRIQLHQTSHKHDRGRQKQQTARRENFHALQVRVIFVDRFLRVRMCAEGQRRDRIEKKELK